MIKPLSEHIGIACVRQEQGRSQNVPLSRPGFWPDRRFAYGPWRRRDILFLPERSALPDLAPAELLRLIVAAGAWDWLRGELAGGTGIAV